MQRKLVALLLIGIIAITGLYTMVQSRAVLAMAEGTLAGELTKALGSAVQVADVQIDSFHSITLHKVNIYDKQGRLTGSAAKAEVTFSLFDVIRGKQSVEAISEIVVDSPQLDLIQSTDGKWNIEDIFERRDQEQMNFSGKVRLTGATVTVTTEKGNWQARDISGVLDFAPRPWTSLKLSGNYEQKPISVEGKINSSFDGVVTVKAAQADVKNFAGLLPADAAYKLLDGRVQDLDVSLQRDKGKLTLAGEVKTSGMSVDMEGFQVRDGQGLITFTDKYIYFFDAAAKLNNQPLELHGKVAINAAEPVFDLNVKSSGFEISEVLAQSPLHGRVTFEAIVKGTITRPVVNAELAMPSGEFNGQPVTAALVKASLNGQQLAITDLRANLYGGQLQGLGTMDINSQQYTLQAQGTGIDITALNILPDLSGAVSFDAIVDGQGSLDNATIQGKIALAAGAIQGIAFTDAVAGFTKSAAQINIDYFAAKTGDGSLTGRGAIQGQVLGIHLLGHNLPLRELNKLTKSDTFSGLAYFEGELTGTLDKPELQAHFRAQDGTVLSQPFHEASGDLVITPEQLSLAGVQAVDNAGSHQVQGTIGLTQNRNLNLTITTTQARAENLVKIIAPGEQLTGNVDNIMSVTGTMDKPNVSGRFRLTDGSFRGYLIAGGEGAYERVDGYTTVRDVVISSLNAQISLAGTVGPDNDLNIDMAAKDVDLSRLHVSYPYPVAGLINFSGKLTGSPEDISFTGNLTASNLKLNGQPLDNVSGSVVVDGSEISVPSFGFSQGGGRYSFSGRIDTAVKRLYGGIDVENGELAPLLTILNVPSRDISGKLNGRITVSGSFTKPNVWLTGNLTGGKLKNYPLDTIDMDVALENNVVTVNRFMAKQGTGILAIRGTADLDGPVNLEIGGRDIDAGLLTVWFDSTLDTKGKLSFAAQMTGTAQNPHTAVSLEIKGGGVSTAIFDSLYGLFVIDQGSIQVNQLLLSKGNYRASAYGIIPLAALNKEGRKNATIADQMDLRIRLDQADLSILPLLTKEVVWANGKTEGEMVVTGTLAQPYIHGNIKINEGAVKLKSLTDPIQKVAVDIQFEGDKISIKSFDGYSGGGSYRLAGSAALKGLALDNYQVLLTLDKIGFDHKYFKGPLTGTLTLTQSGTLPKLSGKLLFENDTIDIPYVPEMSASDLNIGLDLELQAGNRVRFYNAYMYDIMATGRVKLAGTTKRPDVSGRVEATRGTVSYLRTQFKIAEARADFTQFGSFEPVLTLNADTRLERTSVNLRVNGPISAMDIKLTSEPAMSQQEILSLLTLRSSYFDKQKTGDSDARDTGLSRDEVVSLLDAGLQMRFVSELEESFRKAFGLDGFKLIKGPLSDSLSGISDSKTDRESVGDREVYNVEISKYITDRIMLSYTFGIDNKEYNAAFRYDISKRISLTGAVDELNRYRIGVETRFRF